MTTTAKKRPAKTAPRKAAKRVPTNGQANGSAARPAEEFVPFPPPELAAGITDPGAPPQEFVPTTKPLEAAPKPAEDVPPHPYGDKRVYVFRPDDGSAPIVFPYLTEVRPTYYFLWKLRKLNLDQVQQSFEWMDLAEVPDPIQERVARLSDDEQARFFLGWFEPAVQPAQQGAGPPGES
jgi:hypothetical protein